MYSAVVKNQSPDQRRDFDAALSPSPSRPRSEPSIADLQRRIALAHGRE